MIKINRCQIASSRNKTFDKPEILKGSTFGLEDFPVVFFGKNSYLIPGTIHNGTACNNIVENSEFFGGGVAYIKERYCLNFHVGNNNSIAGGCYFMINRDHDYMNTYQGHVHGNSLVHSDRRKRAKGQVLIQNDVWIGQNSTIMAGVTIGNGAVVAANSHVVKDVQPYSIVGGNPAKHIKFRFSEEIIEKLQVIQWWFWDTEKITSVFTKKYPNDIEGFVEEFYKPALIERQAILNHNIKIPRLEKAFIYFCDASEKYSTYMQVILGFIDYFKDDATAQLTIFMKNTEQNYLKEVASILSTVAPQRKCIIGIYNQSNILDEKAIFKYADYYISNRTLDVNLHSCYADMFGVKKLSGVDIPLIDESIL